MPVLKPKALRNNRVEAIRKYHKDAGIVRAELDVSGGIDSAVMLMLLAEALGPDNVTAGYSSILSSDESRERARLVAKTAGVRLAELELNDAFEAIVIQALDGLERAGYNREELDDRMCNDPQVEGSLRSTLRAPVGRFLNRLTGGGIRHGTGNECEDRWLRFYQKGGDGEVDTNPLAMLSKGEVYQLANALNVPREIIEALPTPDLWGVGEEHSDESELLKLSGVAWTYSRIDVGTNKYVRVGTIEAMSRFLDGEFEFDNWTEDVNSTINDLVPRAQKFGLTREHLVSAQKWERSTRHKMNPNCPSLGNREDLVDAGILTNDLPKV